ncbi:hypothetical protein [Actinokineospora sp. NBRC 105648]|uniref:hypothetical protein n=1 Tax=Actinokineospora sp. NBRC 105648 TaxID=3032206 RepID=UPI0024A27B6F|nr:hypothetical protein [Actinokineospora sp. NBRC 105648]GLZ41433.1 hypothetical protein Acsp05_50570 [Actinokineospora sp. NBRC 105648]
MTEQHPDGPFTPMPPSGEPEALQLGIVPLRPLTLTDIVGGAAQALRRNAPALLGIAAVVLVVGELLHRLLTALFIGPVPDPDTIVAGRRPDWALLRPILYDALLELAILAVLGLVITSVVNVVVPRAVFGHTTPPRAALAEAAPALPRLFATTVLTLVVYTLVILIAIMPVLVGGAAGVLLMLPALAGLVYLAIAFVFAPSVVVVEGVGPAAALDRSRKLVHAVGWWRVLGILALAQIALGLLALIISTLFDRISGGSLLAQSLAIVIGGILSSPAYAVVQSLLYIDHRARSEGIEGIWRKAG